MTPEDKARKVLKKLTEEQRAEGRAAVERLAQSRRPEPQQELVAGMFPEDDVEFVARMREKVRRLQKQNDHLRGEHEDKLAVRRKDSKRLALSFPFALGTILLVLKAFGELNIGWVWVLSPFWTPMVFAVWGLLFVQAGRENDKKDEGDGDAAT